MEYFSGVAYNNTLYVFADTDVHEILMLSLEANDWFVLDGETLIEATSSRAAFTIRESIFPPC